MPTAEEKAVPFFDPVKDKVVAPAQALAFSKGTQALVDAFEADEQAAAGRAAVATSTSGKQIPRTVTSPDGSPAPPAPGPAAATAAAPPSPGTPRAEPLQLSSREGANASVFFRTVYFGAAHGAASLEAFLRCLPHVEATAAGSFPAFEAVEVVFDDQPGSGHIVELVEAYRSTNLEGACTSGTCRAAVVCTAHYQMNA